jgi:hypothetical protein
MENILKEAGAVEDRDGLLYPMKSSIKIFGAYEFFLRLTYNGVKVANVPRVGYELNMHGLDFYDHTSSKVPVNLTLIPVDKGGVGPAESTFWLKHATDSYFMEVDDTTVEYEPEFAQP